MQHCAELADFDLLDPSKLAVAAFQACSPLDGDQVTALLACLSQELTCVQGPPGTGKSPASTTANKTSGRLGYPAAQHAAASASKVN